MLKCLGMAMHHCKDQSGLFIFQTLFECAQWSQIQNSDFIVAALWLQRKTFLRMITGLAEKYKQEIKQVFFLLSNFPMTQKQDKGWTEYRNLRTHSVWCKMSWIAFRGNLLRKSWDPFQNYLLRKKKTTQNNLKKNPCQYMCKSRFFNFT